MGKEHANRGVERNKKPLQNIVYLVEFSRIKPEAVTPDYDKYKFKELGYLTLSWQMEKQYNKEPNCMNWHGLITPEELKERLGDKQWGKFCQGKRLFIMQRRIDGKNISKKSK